MTCNRFPCQAFLLVLLLFGASVATATAADPAAAPAAADVGWWLREPIRLIQTNMREIDGALDPVRLMRDIKAMDANAIIFSVGGIRAFYQTDLAYHRKAIALTGDLATAARQAARAEGLRFIARCDMSKADKGFYKDNPDWFQCDAQGRPHEYNGLHICCPNGAYYRDYSHKIIAEIIDRVQPDALFFNMFGFTSHDYAGTPIPLCHCAGCKRRYQEFAGAPLPDDMGPRHPDYGKYLEFRRRSIDSLVKEYGELIRGRSGGACAFFTYVDDADIRRMEANSGIDRRPRTDVFYVAREVGRFKALWPKRPCSCTMVNFLDIPYRYASEPASLTAMRLVQALAYGGELDFYVLGTLDQPDPRSFDVVKQWFRHYKDHTGAYFQSESIARIALINRGGEAFRGAWQLLLERGVPFDVVDLREDFAARDFYGRYRLIWYPGMLSEGSSDAKILEAYVAGGGRLIATCDAERPVPAFFGVKAKKFSPNMLAAYFQPRHSKGAPGPFKTELVYLLGPFLECEPLEGTEAFLSLIPPHSCAPPELAYYTEETDIPGVFFRRHGRGHVVFFPWSIDSLYGRHAGPKHREIVFGLLDRAGATSTPVRVLGDRPVLATARRSADGATILVHLINLTGCLGNDVRAPEPIRDVEVRVALGDLKPGAEARLLVGGKAIPIENGILRIPRIDLLETVAIPLSASQ